jgi:predicted DNA-binding protein (UPF0251 family)
VGFVPLCAYFKPAGIPARELEEVLLKVEEMEAIRLKDLLGLDQEDCAERMGVSRPTFQRILVDARRKIAEVLVDGKALRIEGGSYDLAADAHRCPRCDFDRLQPDTAVCPRCERELSEADAGNGGEEERDRA